MSEESEAPPEHDSVLRVHSNKDLRITLIGAGTIGLSFAAYHLTYLLSPSQLTIYDTRPDLDQHTAQNLSEFFADAPAKAAIDNIRIATSLADAVAEAHIIQESGPENLAFKRQLWA